MGSDFKLFSMNSIFHPFYQKLYQSTGGFFPILPLGFQIFPGDFFQIRNGQIILLGNIFNPRIVGYYERDFEEVSLLNESNWQISKGISKPYAGRGSGHTPIDGVFEYSKQVIAFEDRGSFIFKGQHPKSLKLANWNSMQAELIIKMTQTYYSFREVYVATEVASVANWTLAIAGKENAELEIASEAESFGLVDIFGHETSRSIQSRDIDYYEHEKNRKWSFFKAKKLVVQDDVQDYFISDFLKNRRLAYDWASSFFPNEISDEQLYFPDHYYVNGRASILDLLQANQLNPNTALDYFKWSNADFTDLETVFLHP
jgi:hypothetical protein